jgi:hypothetical protein
LVAPVAVKIVEEPEHTALDVGETATTGFEFTVTATVVIAVQPPDADPVTVYVMVDVGEAITVAPVVALRAVDGDQAYVVPPEAVSETFDPLQIDAEEGVTVIVIEGVTFTIAVACPSHPD